MLKLVRAVGELLGGSAVPSTSSTGKTLPQTGYPTATPLSSAFEQMLEEATRHGVQRVVLGVRHIGEEHRPGEEAPARFTTLLTTYYPAHTLTATERYAIGTGAPHAMTEAHEILAIVGPDNRHSRAPGIELVQRWPSSERFLPKMYGSNHLWEDNFHFFSPQDRKDWNELMGHLVKHGLITPDGARQAFEDGVREYATDLATLMAGKTSVEDNRNAVSLLGTLIIPGTVTVDSKLPYPTTFQRIAPERPETAQR